jgi:hypothetical protein
MDDEEIGLVQIKYNNKNFHMMAYAYTWECVFSKTYVIQLREKINILT